MTLPHRPRLAEHGLLRRHLVDGEPKLLLHDTRAGDALEITPEQALQILACDGTRDLGGVLLEVARQGAYRRASEVETLLGELVARGLLGDGTAPAHPVIDGPAGAPEPADRPLEPLPGFGLTCDGNGSCCTTYSSVPFTVGEQRRALAAVPEVVDQLAGEGVEERLFLPLYGSTPGRQGAVAMVNGACAMLGEDGHCRVHARAGAAAKPRGCQSYPAQFVDDGEAIRVSVAVECRCVMVSADRDGGEPLVAGRVAGDLAPGTRIAVLPAEVAVTPSVRAPRAALRRFTARASEAVARREAVDGVAMFWALADAVEAQGLDVDPDPILDAAAPPAPGALGYGLLALAGKTADLRETVAGWRSPSDRARRLAGWLDRAAQLLLEPELQQEGLAAPRSGPERFYMRAALHGYQLGIGERTVAQGLRDRATRVLFARQLAQTPPGDAQDDPSVGFPLTAVEVTMRGQGLADYAAGLF